MANSPETLYSNEWLSLKKLTFQADHGPVDYIYSHETRCNGKIVVLLPYRIHQGKVQYLLRSEVVPCWDTEQESICAITGGVDHGDTPGQAAVTELEEEAGYFVTKNQLIPLGESRGTKSTDTTYIMFSVDLSGAVILAPSVEPGSCFWTETIDSAVDPLVYTAYHQLTQCIQCMW